MLIPVSHSQGTAVAQTSEQLLSETHIKPDIRTTSCKLHRGRIATRKKTSDIFRRYFQRMLFELRDMPDNCRCIFQKCLKKQKWIFKKYDVKSGKNQNKHKFIQIHKHMYMVVFWEFVYSFSPLPTWVASAIKDINYFVSATTKTKEPLVIFGRTYFSLNVQSGQLSVCAVVSLGNLS